MLESVETRLRDLIGAELAMVDGAIAFSQAQTRAPQVGASAWVVPVSEQPAGDSRTAGPALQKSMVVIGVVIAVRSVNDRHGDKGRSPLEAARDAVRGKLYGWVPEGALVPLLQAGSDLLKMDQSTIWWMDRYITAVQRRAPQQ